MMRFVSVCSGSFQHSGAAGAHLTDSHTFRFQNLKPVAYFHQLLPLLVKPNKKGFVLTAEAPVRLKASNFTAFINHVSWQKSESQVFPAQAPAASTLHWNQNRCLDFFPPPSWSLIWFQSESLLTSN